MQVIDCTIWSVKTKLRGGPQWVADSTRRTPPRCQRTGFGHLQTLVHASMPTLERRIRPDTNRRTLVGKVLCSLAEIPIIKIGNASEREFD